MDSSILKKYHAYLKLEKSLSPNTVEAYERDLTCFLDYLAEVRIDFLNIKREHLTGFMVELCNMGLQPRTQARMVSSIKSFYHFLIYGDLLDYDPTDLLEVPKIGFRIPEVLTIDEINRIINQIDLSKPEGRRNRAILETLYGSGLRVSELVNLKISNIYVQQAYMKVEGKGNKQRLVPLSSESLKQINLWMLDRNLMTIQHGQEDFLFLNRRGSQLTRVMIFKIIKQLATNAEITKNISPHTLRHSFATHMLENGANLRAIQQMLGHESILTTEIYTHIDVKFLRKEILEKHPRNL